MGAEVVTGAAAIGAGAENLIMLQMYWINLTIFSVYAVIIKVVFLTEPEYIFRNDFCI
jgi:hypothetical protein